MTRKEEIEEAALNYGYNNPNCHWNADAEYEEDYENPSQDFMAGAEWADKTMLEKACKWLEENAGSYLLYPFCEYDKGALLEDFKKDIGL